MRSGIITFLLSVVLITFPISQANDHEDLGLIDKDLQLKKITKYQSDSVSTRAVSYTHLTLPTILLV